MTNTAMPALIPTLAQAAVRVAAASAASRAVLKISLIPFLVAEAVAAEIRMPPVKVLIYSTVSTLHLKKRSSGKKKPSVTNVMKNAKPAVVPAQNRARSRKRVRNVMVQERSVSKGIHLLAA